MHGMILGWVRRVGRAQLDQRLGGDKAGTGMGTGLSQHHTGDETGVLDRTMRGFRLR